MSSLTKVKMSSSEDKKVDKLLTMCLDKLDNQATKK